MNRKKTLSSIVIIACFLLLGGCSAKAGNNERINDNKTQVKEISDSPDETNSNNSVKDTEVKHEDDSKFPVKWYTYGNKYGVAPGELTNKDMERPENNNEWVKTLLIRYPQLYNMEAYDKEQRINDLLYKEAAYYHDVLESRDYSEYNVDYQIMEADDNIISILFLGEVTDNQSSNRFAHAVTIDIESGKQMELKDFLMIDKSFVKNHLNTDFKVVDNNFDDAAENTPFVKSFVANYEKSAHTNDYYVKGSDIGIIIPTHNSMGYILIEGSIEEK